MAKTLTDFETVFDTSRNALAAQQLYRIEDDTDPTPFVCWRAALEDAEALLGFAENAEAERQFYKDALSGAHERLNETRKANDALRAQLETTQAEKQRLAKALATLNDRIRHYLTSPCPTVGGELMRALQAAQQSDAE